MKTEQFDVVVIGGGAAGLMCAITAGQRGKKVLLLEHAEKVGKKILISGGGRCNFTNLDVRPDCFLSDNTHFCKSALARYTQHDFIELVERHDIAWHEKTLGQLFCDVSARQIVAMLLAECQAGGVDVRVDCNVEEITHADGYRIQLPEQIIEAPTLVLATGGLSIPKMGATGFAHRIAQQFGLAMTETRPALVPFTFEGEHLAMMQDLSGLSLDCTAQAGSAQFQEAMLFTHRGLSGPAILQISSFWREGGEIVLNMLPGVDAGERLLTSKRDQPKTMPATILSEYFPQRLAQVFAAQYLKPNAMAEQNDKALASLANTLNGWRLRPSGTEGYAKAEVTLGGIDTSELSSKTMEARQVPGLFVIGEAVDVTGWLGGYNFQWAWSSGWAAGMAV
jgi:predicted Rossmann fold flavoprotein